MAKETATKKKVFSGVQPSGKLHIGNYVGAVSFWAENQDQYDNIFCVVDLHALTLPENINPIELRNKTRDVAALYIASGVDPEKCAIFVQSHVHQHAELAWILNCVTPIGWLERMTQFKSKSGRKKTIGTGLLDYPVLQAADILLYQTHLVPVGEDQRQHIELTRDIAIRFNNLFDDVFTIPNVMIREGGQKIMALDDPESKMSKSIGEKKAGHSIGLLDNQKTVRKAIMSAVTDSATEIEFDSPSPGVANLLVLYKTLSGESSDAIRSRFSGKGYGHLKKELFEVVWTKLEKIQEGYNKIMQDKGYIDKVLHKGAQKVSVIAEKTMDSVKKVTGIG